MMILMYFLFLLPVLSLGIDTHDTEGERFLYLPSIFFLVLVVEMITAIFSTIKFQLVGFMLYSVFCFSLLISFAADYKFASRVTKHSLVAINENATYHTIYAVQLPNQYRGALIFRSGFDHAIKWICPNLKFDSIQIVSQRDVLKKTRTFSAQTVTYAQWVRNRPSMFTIETGKPFQVINHLDSIETGKDLILLWTDSSIIKIKPR